MVDWGLWFQRWEQYMSAQVPDREGRFNAILQTIDLTLPLDFTALDLGCGPGSLTKRILDKFPKARCIAVDFDPVLMAIGQGALGDGGGRLEWVDANLLQTDWMDCFSGAKIDLAASASAFHNLRADQIVLLYGQLFDLMPPGAIFLNSDLLPFPGHLPGFNQLAADSLQRLKDSSLEINQEQFKGGFYDALRKAEPEINSLFEERDRRRSQWQTPGRIATTAETHDAALRQAGFAQTGTIWQNMDHRVIMAIR